MNKTVGTRSEPTRIGMRLRKAVRKLLRQVHGTTSAPVVFRDAEVMRLIPMQRRGTSLPELWEAGFEAVDDDVDIATRSERRMATSVWMDGPSSERKRAQEHYSNSPKVT